MGGSQTSFSREQARKNTLNLKNRASLANKGHSVCKPKNIAIEMFSAKYCFKWTC